MSPQTHKQASQSFIEEPVSVYDAMAIGLQAGLSDRMVQTGQASKAQTPWSILDNGIATIQNHRNADDSAALNADRQRRAAWSLATDIRTAWVKAAAAQTLGVDIERAIAAHESSKDSAAMVAELKDLKAQMDTGRADLAALLRISSPQDLVLQIDPALLADNGQKPKFSGNVDTFELLALVSRPEIQSVEARRSLGDVKASRDKALDSFSAIRDVLSKKSGTDTTQWTEFADNFTKGLVRIHTLPVSLKDESSQKFLKSMQDQSLSAAILTEVHLAYNDYRLRQGEFSTAQAESVGGIGDLESVTARARSWLALSRLYHSEMTLINSLGADVLPDRFDAMGVSHLAAALEKRIDTDYASALSQWSVYAANQAVTELPQVADVPSDSAPHDVQLASFTPVRDIMIPLAQKLSARTDISGDLSNAIVNPESFLRVSRWQVQSLLDAPISEP